MASRHHKPSSSIQTHEPSSTSADLSTTQLGSAPGDVNQIDETAPTRLGKYHILAKIGRGAIGTVYKATDGVNPHPLAIKSVRGVSPESLYRFKREFRTLAKIRHRNVVSLYELALEDDCMYFTMEYINGCNFIEHVCGPPLDPASGLQPCTDFARLKQALAQLVRGVQAIHRAGFMHRDIKPSNVLVSRQGRVVLLDFGLVRDLDLDRLVGITAEGAVLGTPLYMAPEQAAGDKTTLASDWYSVGEILYQALTGRAPYAGLSMLSLLSAKKEGRLQPPSELNPAIPHSFERLALDLLARDPDQRPNGDEILLRMGATSLDISTEDSGASLFLGRETELKALRHALHHVDTRRPVVVLIEGASGIGKSALVERFIDTAREPQTVVLSGRCSERESIPYKALDSVLDHLSTHLHLLGSIDQLRAVLPRDVHAIARLFPVLLGVPAIAMSPRRERVEFEPTEARKRGIDALRELFGRIADTHRLIVFIDDLQWADPDSLSLLDAMFRHPNAPPMLLIATHRAGALERNPSLARFAADLRTIEPTIPVHTIQVGPIPTRQAAELARHLLGDAFRNPDGLADKIAVESEGSPFFVFELARHTLRQAVVAAPNDPNVVSLEDVIARRVASLPSAARQVLDAIAVADGELPSDIALNVAKVSDPQTLSHLRAERFIRSTIGRGLEIYHARIHDVALSLLPTAERQPLHLRIARALESAGLADEVKLSHHFRKAGKPELACQHTLAAAEQAAKALAFAHSAELFRSALDLHALPEDRVPEIEAKYGEALAHAGQLHESAAAFRRAADHPEAKFEAEWRRRAAEQLLAAGIVDEGTQALRDALRVVGLELPRTKLGAFTTLVTTRALLSVTPRSVAIRPPETIKSTDLQRLDAMWTAAQGLTYLDHLNGLVFHARHLRLALRCGEPFRIARAFAAEAQLSMVISPEAKRTRASQLLDEAEALAEQADIPFARGFVAQSRGHVALFLGQFRQSVDELDRSIRILQHVNGASPEVSHCQAHKVIVLEYLGRVRQLAQHANTLLRDALDRTNPYVEGFARSTLAHLVLLAADRTDEAEQHLDAYDSEPIQKFQAHRLNYSRIRAAYYRYVGNVEQGWAFTESAYPEVNRLELMRAQWVRAELFFWRASAAVAAATRSADPEPLLRIGNDAARQLLAFPSSYVRGYGHLTKASTASLQQQTDVATSHLRQAVTAFERHEMRAMLAASKNRLADLLGGTEAELLREECQQFFQEENILRPDRFTNMLAPGFVRPDRLAPASER